MNFGRFLVAPALACKAFASKPAIRAETRCESDAATPPRRGRSLVGHKRYDLGSPNLGLLRDSSALVQKGAWEELRERLRQDGYLYLRGLLPSASVRTAKMQVLNYLDAQGLLAEGKPVEEGHIGLKYNSDQGRLRGAEELCETPEIQQCVRHEALQGFFDGLFGRKAVTFDYKWLRCVQTGESTGFHMDTVYMGNNRAPSLVTCWMPMMEVPPELGGLVVSRGSSSNDGFAAVRDTYGSHDLDEGDIGGTGWFTEDPEEVARFGGQLQTAEFEPGDVVLFTMHTMHGSAVNQTRRWRISFDVRWQPEDEQVDPRWVRAEDGSIPGLQSRWVVGRDNPKVFPRTMHVAKRDWGLS